MRTIVFTKPFGRLGVTELVAELAGLRDHGVTGVDLVVRDGQTVTPDEPQRLETVSNALADNGLTLDVVTTDLLAADATADRVLGACATAGVGLVRAGFYRYDPALGHRRCLAAARERLTGLAGLADRHRIRLAVQLHHGTIHPSAAHARLLLDGLGGVRVYADPGNQVKEGSEDWRLCLDLLDGRLACVGVKNATWRHSTTGWAPDWVPLSGNGIVDWPATIAELLARDYPGPLSLHVHYPTPDVPGTLRAELTFLAKALSAARTMGAEGKERAPCRSRAGPPARRSTM